MRSVLERIRLIVPLTITLSLLTILLTFMQAQAATLLAGPLDVVLSEIAWMGTTSSANDEWIELFNTTAVPIDLTGWTLNAADGTPTINLVGTIPAGGFFLLERTDDTTVPGAAADQIYTGVLGNGGEDLVLRDGGSNIIDQVDSSSGWYSGHSEARVPMVRVDTGASGSQAGNWTYNPRCGSATNSAGVFHTCPLIVTNTGETLDYAAYFNPLATTATMTTTTHTEMEDALLSLIDSATTTIDISLYGLNRQSVISALIAAHSRGVAVRVVGDDEAATVSYVTGYQALVNAGILLVIDSSLSQIQHNKFLVVDSQVLWTGSTNFTDTGFTMNANNSIVITSTTLAGVYTLEFAEMWAGNFHSAKTDNTSHLLDYTGIGLESFFSPTDLIAFEVWDELAGAEESIHAAMFFWTDDLLAERTIERLAAGVQVFGVLDQLGAGNVASDDEALCAAGAHIGIEDFAGKLHHKFAVIDVFGDDPVVILGSYNWTDSGAYDNDENTLIIHDADLALAYYAEWQTLWSAIDAEDKCNPFSIYMPVTIK